MHQLESTQSPGEQSPGGTFSERWGICWLLIFGTNVQKDAKRSVGSLPWVHCKGPDSQKTPYYPVSLKKKSADKGNHYFKIKIL